MEWSIVIPTWQRADMLRPLLSALEQQTVRDFEVVIVCDGEDAQVRALAETGDFAFPARWIFHRENRGLAAARNTGAQAATGTFLLFLDDDVMPEPGLLAEHAAKHSSGDCSGNFVMGRIVEDRQSPFHSRTDQFMQEAWQDSLQDALPESSERMQNTVGEEAERSAWFGLNCSITKEFFTRLGGFDSAMRSDEELELGLRLYRSGAQVRYAPAAVVLHRGSKNMAEYYPRCWRLSGELDVHRALEKQERSTQIAQLMDLDRCDLHGIPSCMAWEHPDLVLALARIAEDITDQTGSRTAFAAWARLRHVGEYWSGVRSTGISRTQLTELAAPQRPILMLHSLSVPGNAREATYYTSPRRFRRFLSWLQMRNYTHLTPAEWISGDAPQRSVLLTFDDAYDDLHRELLPLISKFRLKPLVFVVSKRIGGINDWDQHQALRPRSLLNLQQLREMQTHGVVFGSHSSTHPFLTRLSDDALRQEVRDSKAELEDALGTAVEWFAYPYGDVDRRVRAAVLEAGYKAAVTTDAGLNRWQDPLALQRLEVDDRDWLVDFAIKLATGRNLRRSLWMRLGLPV